MTGRPQVDVACDSGGMARRLSEEELTQQLAALPGWAGNLEVMRRSCTFTDFPTAVRAVDEIALVAEDMNHHPDIDIRWRRLTSSSRRTTPVVSPSSTSSSRTASTRSPVGSAPTPAPRRHAVQYFAAMTLPALVVLLVVAGAVDVLVVRRRRKHAVSPPREPASPRSASTPSGWRSRRAAKHKQEHDEFMELKREEEGDAAPPRSTSTSTPGSRASSSRRRTRTHRDRSDRRTSASR